MTPGASNVPISLAQFDRSAITFDFHNTLVNCDDWFELEVRGLPSQFLRWRGDPHDEELAAKVTTTYRELRREVIDGGIEMTAEVCLAMTLQPHGIFPTATEIAEGVAVLMRDTLNKVSLVDGAAELVTTLHEASVPLGIVSSAVYHPFLLDALERFGLVDCFTTIVTSASAGYYKSRPEIYWRALEQLSASPTSSLHIGDSLRFDVGGAARAGMRTAWFNPEGKPAGGEHLPELVLSKLADAAPACIALIANREFLPTVSTS